MKTIQYHLEAGIATITFDEPGSPVNTMCRDWPSDLSAVTAQVLQDRDAIQGIILASAKSTFFAGADLKATMRLTAADAPAVFREIEQTKKNFRTLETLGKPVVSCINGTALGGGWEVRQGQEFVDQETVDRLRATTNWGDVLSPTWQDGKDLGFPRPSSTAADPTTPGDGK